MGEWDNGKANPVMAPVSRSKEKKGKTVQRNFADGETGKREIESGDKNSKLNPNSR